MKRYAKVFQVFLVLLLFSIFLSPVVLASKPDLEYIPKEVYFAEDGRLYIQGYFINNGDRPIAHLNKIDFKVDVKNKGEEYQRIAVFSVRDQDVQLQPGETVNWYFWTRNAEFRQFDYWYVRWHAQWQYGS